MWTPRAGLTHIGVNSGSAQVGLIGLGQLAGAFARLARERVQQADLHVQHGPLHLDCVEIAYKPERRGWIGQHLLPQSHAHSAAVEIAPAEKGGACASLLLGQLDGQQVEGVAAGLWQHLPLRQCDKAVAQVFALAGPGFESAITFKGLQKAF